MSPSSSPSSSSSSSSSASSSSHGNDVDCLQFACIRFGQDITETSSETSNTDKRISKFELCRCDTISNASDVVPNTVTDRPEHVIRESHKCASEHGCDSDNNCGSVHGSDSDTYSSEQRRASHTISSDHCRDTLTDTSERNQMAASDITENSRDSVSGDSVCDRAARTDASELDRSSRESLAKESKDAGGDSPTVYDHHHANEGDTSKAVIRNLGRNRRSQVMSVNCSIITHGFAKALRQYVVSKSNNIKLYLKKSCGKSYIKICFSFKRVIAFRRRTFARFAPVI